MGDGVKILIPKKTHESIQFTQMDHMESVVTRVGNGRSVQIFFLKPTGVVFPTVNNGQPLDS